MIYSIDDYIKDVKPSQFSDIYLDGCDWVEGEIACDRVGNWYAHYIVIRNATRIYMAHFKNCNRNSLRTHNSMKKFFNKMDYDYVASFFYIALDGYDPVTNMSAPGYLVLETKREDISELISAAERVVEDVEGPIVVDIDYTIFQYSIPEMDFDSLLEAGD